MSTELRVVTLNDGSNPQRFVKMERPATVADLVAALIAEGGEIAESVGVTFADMPEGFDGLILAVESRAWAATPGRYLVFPIPVESAEAKETP